MNHKTAGGLASIIIPCWSQLEFTRQCISALRHYTRPPWELIVIDNGSTDGTAAYLSGVQDAAAVPVTVISNRENRGFPAAINQGLQQARGEYLVLLNYAAPPQFVENVPYRDIGEMHRFARTGANTIAGSGSLCPSCRDFACS